MGPCDRARNTQLSEDVAILYESPIGDNEATISALTA